MLPANGQRVTFNGDVQVKGSREHPAVIARTWSKHEVRGRHSAAVDVTIYPVGTVPEHRDSVMLFINRDEAAKYLSVHPRANVCFY